MAKKEQPKMQLLFDLNLFDEKEKTLYSEYGYGRGDGYGNSFGYGLGCGSSRGYGVGGGLRYATGNHEGGGKG